MHILSVDDDTVFTQILLATLANCGHTDVTTAMSARDALNKISQTPVPFDCFLVDIQMPGMSGIELCAKIRTIEIYRHTPIVMVTSMSGKEYINDAFLAGATDYLCKPLELIDIKARLGMVSRLNEARNRYSVVASKLNPYTRAPEVVFDFDEAVSVPGVDRLISFAAMENYLLTLGMKRLFSVTAFSVTVENAWRHYEQSGAGGYLNMLGDVATMTLEGLKTEDVLLAHAGRGIFVGVARSDLTSDIDDYEATANLAMSELNEFYNDGHLPLPLVRFGAPVRNTMFGGLKPLRILELALERSYGKQVKQLGLSWLAA
ncbi:MAG: response regulator [Cypionkella sp.]